MHPLWQIKQIVTIDSERHVDRCMVFGSRSSPRIWCTFMGLVAWIGIYIYKVEDLLHYMDDAFSYDTDPVLQFYAPHDTYYPSKQCRLLTLWDDIGLPHEQRKQVFGQCIEIIGFLVNPVQMSFTMSPESKEALIIGIRLFIDTTSVRRRPLVEWQRLLGWINWGLNTFPLLKPGLQSSYAKIRGKSHAHALIYLNKQVMSDLCWVADTMEASTGLFYFDATEWSPADAEVVIYCDASLTGLGFYCPADNVAYHADISATTTQKTIFYQEALAVLSALTWALDSKSSGIRLLIYTDSMNTVEMFHSLSALPGYNDLLMHAVGLLIPSSSSLRVLHVPGAENSVADALSRGLFTIALSLHPGLVIRLFRPPPCVSGADVQ